jgi:hypothetical protein
MKSLKWCFNKVGEWARKLIICFLNVLKCDIGEVDEAIFHDVEKPFERIFYILGIQISDYYEFEKVMF